MSKLRYASGGSGWKFRNEQGWLEYFRVLQLLFQSGRVRQSKSNIERDNSKLNRKYDRRFEYAGRASDGISKFFYSDAPAVAEKLNSATFFNRKFISERKIT